MDSEKVVSFTPIGVTFETIDKLARTKNPDALALYMGYAGIAHWQKTYRPKATTAFMKKRFGWSDNKFKKAKRVLEEFRLIENVKVIDNKTKKITGWYIQVNHIVSENVEESTLPDFQDGGKPTEVDFSTPSTLNVQPSAINNQKSAINVTSSEKISQIKKDNNSSSDNRKAETEEITEAEKILNEANNFDSPPSVRKKTGPVRSVIVKSSEGKTEEVWLNKKIPLLRYIDSNWKDIYKNKAKRAKLAQLYKTQPGRDVDWVLQYGLPMTNPLPSKDFFCKIFTVQQLYNRFDEYRSEFQRKKVQFEKRKNNVTFI